MDLAFQIMNMVSVALMIVLTTMDIWDKFESRGTNKGTRLPIMPNRSARLNQGALVASIIALMIGFSDLLFVMFGPPRDLPLTGESGALLAYGLIFVFLGFYLRR